MSPRVVLLLLAVGCSSSLPAPDSCGVNSSDESIDSIEIGPGESQLWRPLVDGDSPPLLIDDSLTLVMRIGVTGSPAPDCLSQTTIVSQLGHGQTARDHIPRWLYPQDDGSWRTHTMYLPLVGCCNADGVVVDVTVIAGQKEIYRHLDGTRPPPRDLGVAAGTD